MSITLGRHMTSAHQDAREVQVATVTVAICRFRHRQSESRKKHGLVNIKNH